MEHKNVICVININNSSCMEHTFVIYGININLLMTAEFRVNGFTLMKDTLIYKSSMNTITIQVTQLF